MTDDTHQRETTSPHPNVLDGVSRRTMLKASGVGAAGLALGASASPAAAQEEEDNEFEDIRIPQLHPDTLEAEFEGETLQAESAVDTRPGSTTYVGEAAGRPGLFVAVSHIDGESAQPDEDEQPNDIAMYLCDGEVGTQPEFSLWLTGEFDEGGMTFTGVTDDDQNVEVKMALVDGEFLGVATMPEMEGPVPFVASEATDNAGLYTAESEEHIAFDEPLMIRWVVLGDGRQRGSNCIGAKVRCVCVGISF